MMTRKRRVKKMKRWTRILFVSVILLYLSGCALSDGEPSSSTEEDTLVVQVLSEKALNAEPSDGPLSIEETYDLEEFTDIEIETKEDTYYLTNGKEFEMQLKQLSDSVFQDGEGTRYMVQSN